MNQPKDFPILGQHPPMSIPWEMIAPHEAQAQKNHGGQSLLRIAARGGLGPIEALAVIEGKSFREVKICAENLALFFRKVEAWKAAQNIPIAVTAWHVERDPFRQRRFGKLLEELGELTAVVARCGIQGIDEVEPSSGKTNRSRLQDESADVLAQIELLIQQFDLNLPAMRMRIERKKLSMSEWERLLREGSAT